MAKKLAKTLRIQTFTSKKTTIGNGIHSKQSTNKSKRLATKKKYRGQGR